MSEIVRVSVEVTKRGPVVSYETVCDGKARQRALAMAHKVVNKAFKPTLTEAPCEVAQCGV